MRLEAKLQLWKLLKPDMSSINFNSHDEYFVPYQDDPPMPIYAVHPIPELREYARLAKQHGVKLEIECFGTGAYWAINYVRQGRFWNADKQLELEPELLADPIWLTIFLGWSGQGWTPPTAKAMQYMVDHLPPRANWNISCMAPPSYWQVIGHAIAIQDAGDPVLPLHIPDDLGGGRHDVGELHDGDDVLRRDVAPVQAHPTTGLNATFTPAFHGKAWV